MAHRIKTPNLWLFILISEPYQLNISHKSYCQKMTQSTLLKSDKQSSNHAIFTQKKSTLYSRSSPFTVVRPQSALLHCYIRFQGAMHMLSVVKISGFTFSVIAIRFMCVCFVLRTFRHRSFVIDNDCARPRVFLYRS